MDLLKTLMGGNNQTMSDKYYTVQKNDTLSHIAKQLSGNVNNYDTIAAVNGLVVA